jgi:DNA-binding XRE family transcriptional regulator
MTEVASIIELKQHEDKKHDALSATAAIVSMDPHARKDLICYIEALNEAQEAGDREEQDYVAKAILEVFQPSTIDSGVDLGAWESEIAASSEGREAKRRLDAETTRFFEAYRTGKQASGLTTIREIAKAADLSPTTVQAIEKQRVKPQYKTIKALAKAFGVRPELLTGQSSRKKSRAKQHG